MRKIFYVYRPAGKESWRAYTKPDDAITDRLFAVVDVDCENWHQGKREAVRRAKALMEGKVVAP